MDKTWGSVKLEEVQPFIIPSLDCFAFAISGHDEVLTGLVAPLLLYNRSAGGFSFGDVPGEGFAFRWFSSGDVAGEGLEDRLSLPAGSVLQREGERWWLLGPCRLRLPTCPSAVLTALERLISPGATRSELMAGLYEDPDTSDGEAGPSLTLMRLLGQFEEAGLLHYAPLLDEQPLMLLVPQSQRFRFDPRACEPSARYRLSRLACCRMSASGPIAESPAAPVVLELLQPIACSLFAHLAHTATTAELAARLVLEPALVAHLLVYFRNAGLLTEVDAAGHAREDDDERLCGWAFHDLLFHAYSRAGRRRGSIGAPREEKVGPQPQAPAGEYLVADTSPLIPLFRPELASSQGQDPPFARVLESRRSWRDFAPEPITADQLGDLCFRALRARPPRPGTAAGARPYPNGGARYELTAYLAVRRAAGLDQGFYRYCPERHGLLRLAAESDQCNALWADAATACPGSGFQVLIVLAADFKQVNQRYERMAYALMLKNAAVVLQTIHLCAEAMGLGACILGSGDSDRFAEVSGRDYLLQGSVAEILIGTIEPGLGER